MNNRDIDTVLIYGDSTVGNPDLKYLLGVELPRGGIFAKKINSDPILITSQIDLGSASKGRIDEIYTYDDYDYNSLLSTYGNGAYIRLLDSILKKIDSNGVIGIYGRVSISNALITVEQLKTLGHLVKGEPSPTLLDTIRETKSHDEINLIKVAGEKTVSIIHEVENMFKSCVIKNDSVYCDDSELTVGMVKNLIRKLLAEKNMSQISETILAIGTKSSDPHEHGDYSDIIRANEPIVFDIFPIDSSGYCFDCTRTYVIGEASTKLKEMYSAVLESQELALDLINSDVEQSSIMEKSCKSLSSRGFNTPISDTFSNKENKLKGFIHSLGHGVGLTIGEPPYISLRSSNSLKNGHVFTVEPGLYDPDIGGVRIEDTVAVLDDSCVNLTPLNKSLEL